MIGALTESRDLLKLFDATNKNPNSIVFYSERDVYYQYYEGYLRFLKGHTDLTVHYITSDKKDRAFQLKNDRFQVYYLDLLVPRAIENLKAKVIVMTVPELQNSYLKRSKFSANHVYLCHGMGSTHLQYTKGALDHYDTILCIGPYQVEEIRATENLYGLKRKTLIECGYWWAENLYREGQRSTHNGSILIAPSWHPGNFFESGIEQAIPSLESLGAPVILRPHPEFAKRYPEKLAALRKKIDGTANIRLESELGKSTSVLNAMILVTDWSGISYEYAFALERPVLFINSKPLIRNPDYTSIPQVPIEFAVRGGVIGETIEMADIASMGQAIKRCLESQSVYRERLTKIRDRYLFNWLRSDDVGGKFLSSLCQ